MKVMKTMEGKEIHHEDGDVNEDQEEGKKKKCRRWKSRKFEEVQIRERKFTNHGNQEKRSKIGQGIKSKGREEKRKGGAKRRENGHKAGGEREVEREGKQG